MVKFVPAVLAAVGLALAASASADNFGGFSSAYEIRTPSSVSESAPSQSSHYTDGRFAGTPVANPRTPSSVSESAPTRNHQEQSFTGSTGGSGTVQEYRGGTGASAAFPSSVSESAPWLAR